MKQDKSKKLAAAIIWNTSPSLMRFISELKNNGITTEYTINNRAELSRSKNLLPDAGVLFILVELDWEREGDFSGLKIAKELLEEFGEFKPLNICFVSFASRRFYLKHCSDEFSTVVKEFQLMQLPDIRTDFKFLEYYRERYPFILKSIFNPRFVTRIVLHAIDKASPYWSFDELKKCINSIALYSYNYQGSGYKEILKRAETAESREDLWEAIDEIRNIVVKQSAIYGELIGLGVNQKFNVAIIDDTAGDRSLLKRMIEKYFNIPVGFEFGDGESALERLTREVKKNNIQAVFVDLELLADDGGNQPLQGINLINALRSTFLNNLQIRLVTSLSKEAIVSLGLGEEKVLQKRRGEYALSEEGLHAFFEELNNDINRSLADGLEGPDTGLFKPGTGLTRLYHEQTGKVDKMIIMIKEKLIEPGKYRNTVSTRISKDKTVVSMKDEEKLKVLELLLTHRAIFLNYLAKNNAIKGYSKNVIGWRFLYIGYIKPVDNSMLRNIKSHIVQANDLIELESLVITETGNQPKLRAKIQSIFSEYKRKPETTIAGIAADLENRLENLAQATKESAYCNHVLFDEVLTAAEGELFSSDRPANNYYNTKLGFSGLSEEEDIQAESGKNYEGSTTRFGDYIKCVDLQELKLFPHEKVFIQELTE